MFMFSLKNIACKGLKLIWSGCMSRRRVDLPIKPGYSRLCAFIEYYVLGDGSGWKSCLRISKYLSSNKKHSGCFNVLKITYFKVNEANLLSVNNFNVEFMKRCRIGNTDIMWKMFLFKFKFDIVKTQMKAYWLEKWIVHTPAWKFDKFIFDHAFSVSNKRPHTVPDRHLFELG